MNTVRMTVEVSGPGSTGQGTETRRGIVTLAMPADPVLRNHIMPPSPTLVARDVKSSQPDVMKHSGPVARADVMDLVEGFLQDFDREFKTHEIRDHPEFIERLGRKISAQTLGFYLRELRNAGRIKSDMRMAPHENTNQPVRTAFWSIVNA